MNERTEKRPRRFRPYPEYRDSGVEWLGEIPAHWHVRRADRNMTIWKHPVALHEIRGQDVLHYSIPNVQQLGTGAIEPVATIDSTKTAVDRPLLLVSKLNPRKATIVLARPHQTLMTLASTEFVAMERRDCILNFARYFYLSSSVREELSARVQSATRSHQRCTPEDISKLPVSWPSLLEQAGIAEFLDHETAKIDALVARKERLIELLQEKRTALITRAVTRGLDLNVPMKDSGVEWLGEIPAHWEVKQLKHVLRASKDAIKTGPFGSQLKSSEMQTGRVKVYNQRSVIDRDFSSGENYISLEKFAELSAFEVFPGDLLITTRGSIGRCAILPEGSERGVLHPCLMTVRLDQRRILTRFLEIQLAECSIVLDQLRLMSNATTIDVIYSDSLREVWLSIPPVDEQASMIAFLAREKTRVDALIAKVLYAIDHLKEFRIALISAAVTGKIDVRYAAS